VLVQVLTCRPYRLSAEVSASAEVSEHDDRKSGFEVDQQRQSSNILLWPLSATRSLCTSPVYRFEIGDDPCRSWQRFAANLMDLADSL